jgi:hypothetical protein
MDRFGFTGEHSCVKTPQSSSTGLSSKGATRKEARVKTMTEETNRLRKNSNKTIWLENKRSLKWLNMCENWTEWSTKKHKIVKRRVRKGVPDSMRGKMWEVFSGANSLKQRAKEENQDLLYKASLNRANSKFLQIEGLMQKAETEQVVKQVKQLRQDQQLLEEKEEKQHEQKEQKEQIKLKEHEEQKLQKAEKVTSAPRDHLKYLSIDQKNARKWDTIIEADLSRTFPDHCMFHRHALGQKNLRDVLRAYAVSHPKLGYTQGMNFIAAMFISYMPARDAYWMLTAVMDSPKWDLQSMFCDRTPAVSRIWYQFDKLLAKYVPKVSTHFKQEGMDHSMYLTKWVIPLYTRDFHFDFVVRVWDIFLHQGWKIIFRVALALLKQSQNILLKMDMEKIMYYLRDLPKIVNAEETLKLAHRIKFKTKELEDLREEFEKSQK